MESRIVRIISILFHPIFLPLYCLLVLFSLKSYFTFEIVLKAKLMLLLLVSVTTILFPLFVIYLMKRQGFINSYEMETKEERRYPYLITTMFYFLTYNMFRQLELPGMYTYYMMGASFLLIVVIVINIWWKISIHMVGLGGVFGMITQLAFILQLDLLLYIMIILFIAGLVGYARLKAKAHKPAEVYAGFLVGASVMMTIIYLI